VAAEPLGEAFAQIKPFRSERMVIHQIGEALKSDHGGMTAAG
jgi:hypothetical protein